MNIPDVLSQIDAEISKLQQARGVLAGNSKGNGHRKATAPKRSRMSDAGRARIVAAQRARWAKQKKAAK